MVNIFFDINIIVQVIWWYIILERKPTWKDYNYICNFSKVKVMIKNYHNTQFFSGFHHQHHNMSSKLDTTLPYVVQSLTLMMKYLILLHQMKITAMTLKDPSVQIKKIVNNLIILQLRSCMRWKISLVKTIILMKNLNIMLPWSKEYARNIMTI